MAARLRQAAPWVIPAGLLLGMLASTLPAGGPVAPEATDTQAAPTPPAQGAQGADTGPVAPEPTDTQAAPVLNAIYLHEDDGGESHTCVGIPSDHERRIPAGP